MQIYAIVGGVAGAVLLLVIGIGIYCMLSKKSNKTVDIFIPKETFEAYANPIWKKAEVDRGEALERLAALKTYSFIELQSVTDDFSQSCLIKGSVYRGRINGELAAIKRMKSDVSTEISFLAKINHFNLVRVLGVCYNDGNCYLVYEYASNGPLSDWIYYNNNAEKFLNWTQRIQIILDVARGLNYIHSFFSPPHVHKGIRSSNILLDNDLRAKISNFGLMKPTLDEHSQGAEKGYLSPEFLRGQLVSPKLDVYAFGVLMLEMVTGRKVTELNKMVHGHLSEILAGVLREENATDSLMNVVDPSLHHNYPPDMAIFLAGLIDNCLKQDASLRPIMDEIVRSLSKVLTASLAWESSYC